MEHYSSPADVIRFTGTRPEDFGLAAVSELEALILPWLVQAKDLIDTDRNRDYHAEVTAGRRDNVPPGIHNIAMRIVANMLALAVLRRETPVVKVGDFAIQVAEDQVFTASIRKDLRLYPAISRIGMRRVDTSQGG